MTACLLLPPSRPTSAQTPLSGDPIRIERAAGAITIDGALDDAGWRGVPRIEKWYETNPGDNIEPSVGNVGVLAYDDRYLYAGFEFDDPDPGSIRAPLGDRDHVLSVTDYGGIIVDSRNSGRSAVLLLTNPRSVQYDAVTDDASGESSSPDFFWESAARITDRGWTLEMRVPFSWLRYSSGAQQAWGILLYRNRPRDFRYQMFSARLPRGGNCFICRSNPLVGLDALPTGSHFVLAPFLTASHSRRRIRADTGFVPQVGYRRTYGEAGYPVSAKRALSRLRTFVFAERQTDSEGALITRVLSPSVWMDARGTASFGCASSRTACVAERSRSLARSSSARSSRARRDPSLVSASTGSSGRRSSSPTRAAAAAGTSMSPGPCSRPIIWN